MTLYVLPHALGVILRSHVPEADRVVLGDLSELIIDGDSFGGLSYQQIVALASAHKGMIDESDLRV